MKKKNNNIPLFKVFMPKTVIEPLCQVLFSGYIGEGPKVKDFEHKLSSYLGNDNILALNNGTAAIQLALRLSNLAPGDEVISTPMTCSATNMPIMAMGGKIVWADINPETANIDTNDVEKKITSKTKAIICVHWGGYPCDMDRLKDIATRHNIRLIEDACHAFGSVYKKKPIGSHSDFVCFSFQAIKELTTVDGGVLTCKHRRDYDRGKLLRWYGINREIRCDDLRCEEDISEYGYKFHMNDVTATIGLEQLKYVNENIAKHRANASLYNKAFSELKNVSSLKYQDDRLSSYWLYTLKVENRDKFMKHMLSSGITVSKIHARNDYHTVFRNSRTDLPGVDQFYSRQVSIPVGWWLTQSNLDHIINTVLEYDKSFIKP